MKNLETAKQLWSELGNIPIDNEECLDEDFVTKYQDTIFEKGTDMYEVWHWFDETFNVSIAKDLMNV